jgi:phosphoheptose isomerase
MPYRAIDLSGITTYRLGTRRNLVTMDDLAAPDALPPAFSSSDLVEVARRIAQARRDGRPVIWMMGAHVIKRGLSRVLIDLMERGIITHVASNGAGSIHDFELALIGETSEDVPTSIEDGSFGMAEETGRLMNEAIQSGARDGLGYGEALGRCMDSDEGFRYRQVSVAHNAYRLGIPYTVHATIGTDIIHQHPAVDFGALGWASGQDFKTFAAAVAELEGGVFLNFGSAVTGPEVFLKALSIARNLGHRVAVFTTANFDLVDLGDYRSPVGTDHPHYYYRPRKNIVNRPVSLGGKGFHISGDHAATIPNLYHLVRQQIGDEHFALPTDGFAPGMAAGDLAPAVARFAEEFFSARPVLASVRADVLRAYRTLAHCLETGGTVFLCGNGGSFADALHISGELLKSYERPRPLPEHLMRRLKETPGGDKLAANLQGGLRAVVLGANLALASAVQNDFAADRMGFAQELLALARGGDVLLGISTSGNAENVLNAVLTARALGLPTILLTGQGGGRIAPWVDVAIRAPARGARPVQELHQPVYHALCGMLELHFFG